MGVHVIRFGRYQLDRAQGLQCGTQDVRVTPKALSVLWVLAERAGEMVTKEELFHVVWPDTAVSDSALTSCIQELRHALRDDARKPRFIETLHRRGYRFLARTSSASLEQSQPALQALSVRTEVQLVGREPVLKQMLATGALAQQGARQVLFVTGEPGIGKTAVVQTFLPRMAARGTIRTTWGACVQHYGIGEPYQPLLEALTRLCRQPAGDRLIPLLERYSPTWLAQLPGLLAPARLATLRRTAVGATRERMLRELNDVLEVMAAQMPLVLWLEDLHWSDTSTLDWIASFAQRPEPARLLLIGTFRPPAVAGPDHPLGAVSATLQVKRFCHVIALSGLDEGGVVDYLTLRFPPAPGQGEVLRRLARLVHHQTGGNPLFVVNILGDLVVRGLLVQQEGRWTLTGDINAPDLSIPDDVRKMIEQHVDRLLPGERAVLEIASVTGATFSAAAVAAGAGLAVNEVETKLASLARRHQFVRETGVFEWPDGTIAARFDFLHVLYRDVLYQRVPAGIRADLHRLIGGREETAYADRAREIAAELAMHFERSRDMRRAGIYLQHAAENARRRSAYKEARMHFERALALLESEPPGLERTEREVALRIGMGAAIMATRGWSAPEAEHAYSRARLLCHGLGDTQRLFPALWGLWLFYLGKGSLSMAREIAQDLLAQARRDGGHDLLLQAHHASWTTAFLQGDIEAARTHADEGISFYRVDRHAAMAATYGSHDVKVCGQAFLAWTAALQGRAEEAVRTSDQALALARDLGHPFSLAQTHVFAAEIAQVRREGAAIRTHAAAATAIAREQDFRLMFAWASTLEGWAKVDQGQHQEGLEQIDNGLAETRAIGNNSFLSYFLGLRAEASLKSGQTAIGFQTLDEAFAIVRSSGERFWEAELHRLRGELHLAANALSSAPEAENAFLQALAIAQSQGSKLLVLRVAINLGRLWGRLGRTAQARQLLAETCRHIDGFNLPEIGEAKTLCDHLSLMSQSRLMG